jgi:hypothetical protein
MGRIRPESALLVSAVGLALTASTGCYDAGALIYTMGLAPEQEVEAEYELTAKDVLVLVDDPEDLVRPGDAEFALVDEVAKQLYANEIAERVTTHEEIAALRRAHPDFHEKGVREIGELANVDRVIWLTVTRFKMQSDLEMVVAPASFAVTVKLINAKAEKPGDVRLWPTGREGHLVEIEMGPHEIRRSNTLKEAHQKLAAKLAEEVVNLFYKRTIGYE